MVTRAYRNSLNTHHQLWRWPARSAPAVLQLAVTLVNAPLPPPAWPPLPAAFPPTPTSCTRQCNFAVSFSKDRKHQKTVTPCIGEEKHNWTCLPHQDPSTASNKYMESFSVSWVSFDFTQFPATHFRAHHTVDFCTGVTHPVLRVHLFSLFVCPLLLFFLTSLGSESCFPRPLSNNPSSAVLCMEGCSLNLFSQKAHHKTCLISSYLVCSHQTESIYRPCLLLTLLSALDNSSLPPLSKIKC